MVRKVLSEAQRLKEDEDDDLLFYARPRFVYHLDEHFRSRLTRLYRERISETSVVLDLMSSWVSYLPEDIKYKRVLGHGLNSLELEKNERLDSYWVQNLNLDYKLPLDDSSIDACLMVAAWQYLQYPEELASEIRRVISPGGQLIVSFSNRAFWTKAPSIWKESSDSQRINYIKIILISQGWSSFDVVEENYASTGIFSVFSYHSDPFFSLIAMK